MPRLSREGSRNMDATQDLIRRVRDAGAVLARKGNSIGSYFEQLDTPSIATQRHTKDQLPRRLKASADEPQVVTVQARGGEEGGAYVILPLEKIVEVLEAQGREEPFVPITASLREIGGDLDLPVISPRRSGRPLRSSRPAIIAPKAALASDG